MFILGQRNLETRPRSHSNLCLKFPVRSECWTFKSAVSLVTLSLAHLGPNFQRYAQFLLTIQPQKPVLTDQIQLWMGFSWKYLSLSSYYFRSQEHHLVRDPILPAQSKDHQLLFILPQGWMRPGTSCFMHQLWEARLIPKGQDCHRHNTSIQTIIRSGHADNNQLNPVLMFRNQRMLESCSLTKHGRRFYFIFCIRHMVCLCAIFVTSRSQENPYNLWRNDAIKKKKSALLHMQPIS